jgi:hypothetical protein
VRAPRYLLVERFIKERGACWKHRSIALISGTEFSLLLVRQCIEFNEWIYLLSHIGISCNTYNTINPLTALFHPFSL